MKLSQVKDSTWVIEANQLIPFYRLDASRCILLDSGLKEERDAIESLLLENGLVPAGILCSHAHVDHCANNGYFQQKYRIPVALTAPEAGMCSSLLNLKCYFLTLSPDTVERESAVMLHTPDVIVPPQDGPFSFAGAEFQIIHTPGHSSGHIAVITPDRVCYAADALLSHELMRAKLPYNLSHQMAQVSREKLRGLDCGRYIMAHRGVCSGAEIDELINENHQLIQRRAEEVLSLIDRPMTASEIGQRACELYQLFTQKPTRSLRFERNIRFLIEYLTDTGLLTIECRRGTPHYRPVRDTGPLASQISLW